MTNIIKIIGLTFGIFLLIGALFIYNPKDAYADGGTCCPDEGICVVDGEPIGMTHFWRSDGKPCDAPYDKPPGEDEEEGGEGD